jgi:outer membrane lipoprotein-sorting protein
MTTNGNAFLRGLRTGLLAAGVGAAVLIVGSSAWSASKVALTEETLSADQLATIRKLTSYFNSFRSLKGEFTQVSPRGNVSAGVFYLAKPGRLRFEYAPPNPFLVVSDGSWVVIENRKKKTTDQYPLAATPLKLLLSEDVDLLKQAQVMSVETADGLSTITVQDRNKLTPGQIVLVFDNERKELAQWIIEDGQGKRTTISVANLETEVEADPKLFVVKIAKRKSNK